MTEPLQGNWNAWPEPAKLKLLDRLRRLDSLSAAASGFLWKPLPGPQTLAYESPADVIGYGGAAGGGKTDLAIGLALNNHKNSIIFRREAKQLRAISDRCREILGDAGRFNENSGIWRDLPGGRQIEFGGCKDPGDEQGYRGRPHDLIALDEADQFLRFQFLFLTGWLRTTVVGQRCQVLLTFNPPSTAEGEWILEYFAPWLDPAHPNKAKPCELRWYAMVDGKEVERPDGLPFDHRDNEGKPETIQPQSRTFIPAKVTDNPILISTGYRATLQAMPEPLRSQLLYGDFTVGRTDDPWQVIPTAWVKASQARWRPEKPDPDWLLSCVGVDPARGGADKTVLARRYRTWFAPLEKHPGSATPDGPAVVALIGQALTEWGKAAVHVDVIGIGASVYDLCRLREWSVYPVNFAGATQARDLTGVLEFANVRAWAYWRLREALDPQREEQIALPPDPELLADLTAPRWKMTLSGVQVEKKEDIVKRIGRSPDCADAVVNAHLPLGIGIIGVTPREGKDWHDRTVSGRPGDSHAGRRGMFGR